MNRQFAFDARATMAAIAARRAGSEAAVVAFLAADEDPASQQPQQPQEPQPGRPVNGCPTRVRQPQQPQSLAGNLDKSINMHNMAIDDADHGAACAEPAVRFLRLLTGPNRKNRACNGQTKCQCGREPFWMTSLSMPTPSKSGPPSLSTTEASHGHGLRASPDLIPPGRPQTCRRTDGDASSTMWACLSIARFATSPAPSAGQLLTYLAPIATDPLPESTSWACCGCSMAIVWSCSPMMRRRSSGSRARGRRGDERPAGRAACSPGSCHGH